MLGRDRYGFHEKRASTHYVKIVFLQPMGSLGHVAHVRGEKRRRTIFHSWVGPVWITQKSRWDTLHQTFVFASGGIYGSRSAFWCVRDVK
jgi:hypothetical protein